MIDVESIQAAAATLGPHEIATRLGIEIDRRSSTRERARVLCPVHGDSRASCDVQRVDDRIVAICRSCGEGGDLLWLVAAAHDLDVRADFVTVARVAAELVGVEIEDGAARRRRRPSRDERVTRLVNEVDRMVDDVLRDRPVRPSGELRAATLEELTEALALFDGALDAERDRIRGEREIDAALDRIGDDLERRGVIASGVRR